MRSFNRFFALSALAALNICPPAVFAIAAVDPQVQSVLSWVPVYARRERDQRIGAYIEPFKGQKTVHVYLGLTEQSVPYSFSLGWFTLKPGKTKDSNVAVDEFGEQLPAGDKPDRAGFNKADLLAIKGFDVISEGKAAAALKLFQTAAKIDETSARIHNNLGAIYALTDKYGEAQKELDQALKLKPDYAVALANRAWLALAMKQPELAAKDAGLAMEIDKTFQPAALAAARASLALGKIDQSISIADRSAKGAEDPAALVAAGDALRAKGDLKGAAQRYQKALLLAPHSPDVLLQAAQVEEQLGDLDGAMKYARGAVQSDGSSAAAHLLFGHLLEADRQYRAAQLQYERTLELNPPQSTRNACYGPLLRVLLELNRLQEAQKLAKKWAAENPKIAECHYNRAWLESQVGGAPAKKDAIDEYRKALALKPELVQAHYNLALLLLNDGQPEQATKELRIFIEKSPKDPDVGHARELLAKLRH